MRLYDAHNHLQDDRFGGRQEELLAACRAVGVVEMVVNGSGEADWPQVAALAQRFPDVVRPSFGCHPWYVGERTPAWQEAFEGFLDRHPGAGVGEIGLDRWKPGLDLDAQEAVFICQFHLAAKRELAVSIHCLEAWGRLYELLRTGPRLARGFLLHSYGGPIEMVTPLARLGAYFSLPGYFAHERKHRQRATFKAVPADRLLIETDAPDQRLPEAPGRDATGPSSGAGSVGMERCPLRDPRTGAPLNHPANLPAVYELAAVIRGEPVESLALQIEANFLRLFGSGAGPGTTRRDGGGG